MKLFLKGDRCFSTACAIERRNYPPGEHGQRRIKLSDYGIQLREKQKMKRMYGLLERQFRRAFAQAERQPGITGENLVRLLERRLDTVVHRLGFAASRAQARMFVRHGHIQVNGRAVNIPSVLVQPGDVIEVRGKSRELLVVKAALEGAKKRGLPAWLELDGAALRGTVRSVPSRADLPLPVQEQLIVALYSK
jgi:small subunit ribosomal protein S4